MSTFIYFIPGQQGVTRKIVEAAGCLHAWEEGIACSTRHVTSGGPGDLAGILFCLRHDGNASLVYKPDTQTWVNCGDYWFGYNNDSLPTVEDLRKAIRVNGTDLVLGDGGTWHIPMVRLSPKALVGTIDGEWALEPDPRYRAFVDLGIEIIQKMIPQEVNPGDEEGTTYTIAEAADYAVKILAWNYRIGKREVQALKLLSTENIGTILATVIDMTGLVEAQKKTADNASVLNCGQADG